jgi:hypothetical protein
MAMKLPRIVAVDLVNDGIVVHYDDASTAFYHESVLQQHLLMPAAPRARRTRLKQAHDVPSRELTQSAA